MELKNLKDLIDESGLKFYRVASELGVSTNKLRRIINGQPVDEIMLTRMVEFFKIEKETLARFVNLAS